MTAFMTWDTSEIEKKIEAAKKAALEAGGEHVLEASREVVPVGDPATPEWHVLHDDSGVEVEGDEAIIWYGDGEARSYALRQHEDLGLRHDAGRRSKYLERPLQEQAQAVRDIAARAYKKAFE